MIKRTNERYVCRLCGITATANRLTYHTKHSHPEYYEKGSKEFHNLPVAMWPNLNVKVVDNSPLTRYNASDKAAIKSMVSEMSLIELTNFFHEVFTDKLKQVAETFRFGI